MLVSAWSIDFMQLM